MFSPDGKVIQEYLGKDYSNLHDMEIREEDGVEYIYGARNANAEGIKFNTRDGKIVLRLKFPEQSGLKIRKFSPTAITVTANGDIYLSKGYGSNHIFKYDKNGKYLSHFGEKGNGLKQFNEYIIDNQFRYDRLMTMFFCDQNIKQMIKNDKYSLMPQLVLAYESYALILIYCTRKMKLL